MKEIVNLYSCQPNAHTRQSDLVAEIYKLFYVFQTLLKPAGAEAPMLIHG